MKSEIEPDYGTRNDSSSGFFGNGSNSTGRSESESITKRDLVLTSELLSKRGLFEAGGMGGFYSLQNIGDFRVRVSTEWVFQEILPKSSEDAAIVSRDTAEQKPTPWNESNLLRLGLFLQSKETIVPSLVDLVSRN